MTTYPFTAARYDFGARKGPTLGLMFHGAEANAGVVGYLSRDPSRNVSANFVCERSGRMVRMLPFNHASGSLNPADRSSDKAYFGVTHLKAVLGSWWRDPNAAVVSVEIEMYAREGPNIAQVASLIDWSKDMRSRFPSIRGALGHADQTDTKGCPGATANMRLVFSSIGGHGLWTGQQEDDMARWPHIEPDAEAVRVKPKTDVAHAYLDLRADKLTVIPDTFGTRWALPAVLTDDTIDHQPGGAERKAGYVTTGDHTFVLATDVTVAPAVVDCTDAVEVIKARVREVIA